MKKYGFTLIELLAVIVILAVIALIATPIILGLISDSKKQAFKNSTYGISQAAKNNYALTVNLKGDAVWEISNNINGSYSWFGDFSYMPNTNNPWFGRGGLSFTESNAGILSFGLTVGNPVSSYGFRPVLAVAPGL